MRWFLIPRLNIGNSITLESIMMLSLRELLKTTLLKISSGLAESYHS